MEYRGIALVGPMAAGKTTIANALMEGYGFRHLSMIGAFRELFAEAYPGLSKGDEVNVLQELPCRTAGGGSCGRPEHHTRPRTLSVRGVMQAFAPATRAVDSRFWTRIALNRAEALMADGVPHVSDDVRYLSEAVMVRERGLLVVRVDTPRDVRLERYEAAYGRLPTPEEEGAPSEREIPLIKADTLVDGTADPRDNAEMLADLLNINPKTPIRKTPEEDTTSE